MIIESGVQNLRDPYVLIENGIYYMYGTGVVGTDWNNTYWACYKNESGSLDGEWIESKNRVYKTPKDASMQFWAPEVHKYNDEFYMFATYYSDKTGRRGCTILKSSSPEGPFIEISDGQITPPDWDSIDGTLYIDKNGNPWMVFVHEFCSLEDRIGRMAAAQLSSDFTHFISEPIELFRADDPEWADDRITDGCFMYDTADGQLIMLWSNFKSKEYRVGTARSSGGKIDGIWTHDKELIFSKEIYGKYDGGHGMLFKDTDGIMYMAVHAPNVPVKDRAEMPVFVQLKEENGKLVVL